MTIKNKILSSLIPVAVALALPLVTFGEEKKPAANSDAAAVETVDGTEKANAAPGSKLPYHGKVAAVDKEGKTFSLKGKEKERVFTVTAATKITKDGNAVDLSTIPLGEEVRGQAIKSGDRWEAASVMLGEKPDSAKAKKAEAAEPKG